MHTIARATLRHIAVLALLWAALLVPLPVLALCSPYLGTVVFNEIQIPASGTTYLELRVMNPSVVAATNSFTNFGIGVYKATSGSTSASTSTLVDLKALFTDTAVNSCGQSSPWVRIPNASIANLISDRNDKGDLNFVLYETATGGTKRIVDVLRVGNANSFYGKGSTYESCPTIEAAYGSNYDRAWGSNGNKNWFRSPDGTGTWSGAETANNSNSICGSNTATTASQIGLTKVANTPSVNTNTNFSFTLYAQNPLTGNTQANVSVRDDLNAAGLSYVGCAATAPDTCSESAGVLNWTVSSLPPNSTRSAVITVRASTTGVKTNTITSGIATASASVVTISNLVPGLVLDGASTTATTATLSGTINPNGNTSTLSIGYSTLSGSYTSVCTPSASSFGGATAQGFSCSLSGLTCGTTYYARATASNSAGTTNSSELAFTTAACAGTVFDVFEATQAAQDVAAKTVVPRIYTRVASSSGLCLAAQGGSCTPASLTVAAFNSTQTALQTTFAGPVKVEMVDASAGSCATHASIATVSASLSLAPAGQASVALPAVANVYPNARVRVSYPATGTATSQSCSSDNFAIRPHRFVVLAQNASWTTEGSSNTLSTTSWTSPPGASTPVHKAGRPFRLTVSAVNLQGTATTLYHVRTPQRSISSCSGNAADTACTTGVGSLTTATESFTNGLLSTVASYNEVGAFTLGYTDSQALLSTSSFTAVDASDGADAALGTIAGTARVGRFVPDHFETSATQGCSSFTYSGQPLALQVTAKAYGPGNTTTALYAGSTANALTLTNANPGVTGKFTTTTIAASSFVAGVSTTTPVFTFSSRSTSPFAIKLRVTDTDLVDSTTGSDGTALSAVEASSTIVSGRLALLNAYGSEQLPLPVTTRVEYFDTLATGWRPSGGIYADTCTRLAASNLAFTTTASACSAAVASCITSATLSGTGAGPYTAPWTLRLAKPSGPGNACVGVNLDGTAVGKQCTAAVSTGSPASPGATATAVQSQPSWLRYPWAVPDTPYAPGSNPSARFNFGIYKSPLVFRRENY